MRAIGIEEYGGAGQAPADELPATEARNGGGARRVVSAGVNPLDCRIRSGQMREQLDCRLPMIPGWDVAGSVEDLGEGASRFRRGDRVWAFAGKPAVQWGCYAEYVAVPESSLAMMPAKLLFEEAAAVPVAALAAHQSLFAAGELRSGKSVLIHGAGRRRPLRGATGERRRGASLRQRFERETVLRPVAGSRDRHRLHEGRFRRGPRAASPRGVDLVIDLVGGETLDRSYDLVKQGGRIISLVEHPDSERAAARALESRMLFVEPDGDRLMELAQLFDGRRLKTHVQKIYPLSKAIDAHHALEQGHVQGKLVLNL